MQETYYTKAIILTREPFREYDSKIITYTLAKGKLELVARGTKKILSKLAGHLEPITLSDIMVIKGKQFNYVGTATSTNTFLQIKKNLEKLTIVGAAIKVFNELIKENEADKDIFSLLGIFLFLVNDNKTNLHQAKLLVIVFKIKLIILLGYQPLLDSCLVCGNKKIDNNFIFDYEKGGIICGQCQPKSQTTDNRKILSSLIKNFSLFSKIKLENSLKLNIIDEDLNRLEEFIDDYILANIK